MNSTDPLRRPAAAQHQGLVVRREHLRHPHPLHAERDGLPHLLVPLRSLPGSELLLSPCLPKTRPDSTIASSHTLSAPFQALGQHTNVWGSLSTWTSHLSLTPLSHHSPSSAVGPFHRAATTPTASAASRTARYWPAGTAPASSRRSLSRTSFTSGKVTNCPVRKGRRRLLHLATLPQNLVGTLWCRTKTVLDCWAVPTPNPIP